MGIWMWIGIYFLTNFIWLSLFIITVVIAGIRMHYNLDPLTHNISWNWCIKTEINKGAKECADAFKGGNSEIGMLFMFLLILAFATPFILICLFVKFMKRFALSKEERASIALGVVKENKK